MKWLGAATWSTVWLVVFSLPFIFFFADPNASPSKIFGRGWKWVGGLYQACVELLGPEFGRGIFCAMWLALDVAIFYAIMLVAKRRTIHGKSGD